MQQPAEVATSFDGSSDHSTPESEELDVPIAQAGNTYLGKLPIVEFLYYSDFHKPIMQWRDNSLIRACRLQVGAGLYLEANQRDNIEALGNRLYDQGHRMSHLEMIRLLIQKGHVSTSRFLGTIFRSGSERRLEILGWLCDEMDIADLSTTALGVAAFHNDFEAVDMLLDFDADVNGNISHPHSSASCPCKISVIAYAQLPNGFEGEKGASGEMIACLLSYGALRSTGVNSCLLGALRCALRRSSYEGLIADEEDDDFPFALVRSIVEQIQGFSDVVYEAESILEAFILETSPRTPFYYQALEYLLDQGATPSYGSPLAILIYKKGSQELVEKLLAKTENINAYCSSAKLNEFNKQYLKPLHYRTIRSLNPLQAAALQGDEETIHLLLEHGADVNSPARDIGGVTPLQAICCTKECSLDHEKRMRIVELFVDHTSGLNINAAPAWAVGLSALQGAAAVGDIQVARFLLSRGADINAPACKYGGGTALALATRQRQFWMVDFLLENGATIPPDGETISSFGVTYDDNRSISKLLGISAQDLENSFGGNGTPARDWHEYEVEWANDPTYEDRS